jgi:hypothetical protein
MRKIIAALAIVAASGTGAAAFDHGFDHSTARSQFFRGLKRPDHYPKPCCGDADAYEADTYTKNPDGSYDVVITDGSEKTYPDGVRRIEIPNGSKVHVPANQINPPKETKNNPTGHAWLFMSVRRGYGSDRPGGSAAEPGTTYCFAPLPEGS